MSEEAILKLKRISALVHAVLPFAIRPVWYWVRALRAVRGFVLSEKRGKRILLVCQNPVAADHLRPIVVLLKQIKELKLYATNDHFPSQEISGNEIRTRISAKYINILLALFCDWDLVIYVNHPWGFASWLLPSINKIYINHGLHTGKINNIYGEDGVYGSSRTTRPHRGLLYDRMFASSSSERRSGIIADPSLSDKIVVTGSLMVDTIKSESLRRDLIRERMGFRATDQVVHVISTWGPTSLAATVGETLLRAAKNLGPSYRFLLSLHPRYDKFGGTEMTRVEILNHWSAEGFQVDEKNDKWIDFVVASDMAIADNSSLAFYHFIMNKPVIFVPVEDRAFVSGSAFDILRSHCSCLNNMDDLGIVMSRALNERTNNIFDVSFLADHIGSARSRHIHEIKKMLNK